MSLPDSLTHLRVDQLQATRDRKAAHLQRTRDYYHQAPEGDERRSRAWATVRQLQHDLDRLDDEIDKRWLDQCKEKDA